jgi:hypothetical protein
VAYVERTRLDEIIEQESIPTRTIRESAERIADRAFRHGVDEAFEFINNREGAARLVRPALQYDRRNIDGKDWRKS